ncbi:hypothetical protein U0027_00560 [Agrobacterium tumefaciens]|uniref:hypothetical protein n=1 Tax=Agrobacterium tumefaciens TaxID=358 RepID=UPI0013B3DDEC|nr:hypothetical protein [Agrobacterium tumefaciens]WQE40040.1 hypothetical protein U0027_00560 [Agrobacterium tumefaciens]
MRKLSLSRQVYLIAHAKRLHSRHLAWKAWRKAKRKSPSGRSVIANRDGTQIKATALASIPMPEIFCLDENTAGTLRFLDGIWDEILQFHDRKPLIRRSKSQPPVIRRYIDFTTVKYISPSAALVLAALFQRSKVVKGHKLSTIDEHKWDPFVAAVLRAVGFHDLLDMRPLPTWDLTSSGFKILKFQSGTEAVGETPGKLQEALAELLPSQLAENLLTAEPYGGMFEAILNSHSWAYPADYEWNFPVVPYWWITGAVDTTSNQVTVCAFDQGVSIPVSLPRWTHWGPFELRGKRLIERLKLSKPIDHFSNDGLAIQLAVKISRTSTKLPQHGKGLHTMVEVAERARHGRLRILSRNGEFTWETGKKPSSTTHEFPIRGTLVEWQLQL